MYDSERTKRAPGQAQLSTMPASLEQRMNPHLSDNPHDPGRNDEAEARKKQENVGPRKGPRRCAEFPGKVVVKQSWLNLFLRDAEQACRPLGVESASVLLLLAPEEVLAPKKGTRRAPEHIEEDEDDEDVDVLLDGDGLEALLSSMPSSTWRLSGGIQRGPNKLVGLLDMDMQDYMRHFSLKTGLEKVKEKLRQLDLLAGRAACLSLMASL